MVSRNARRTSTCAARARTRVASRSKGSAQRGSREPVPEKDQPGFHAPNPARRHPRRGFLCQVPGGYTRLLSSNRQAFLLYISAGRYAPRLGSHACTGTTPTTSRFVAERVAQFRDQTRRFLAGELTEDEFRPLRLQNGLYIQKYAPMLRVAIPYGLLSTTQLRTLAHIARKYDRGYGHFTTRQNIQFNWPRLEDVPDILAELAAVEMHAIQTSGNCVRNITSDHFAGVAGDEIVDPRPYCELIRQWSTFHPEFAYLPRKFKIAVIRRDHRSRGDAGPRHRRARACATPPARSASGSWSAAAWAARR